MSAADSCSAQQCLKHQASNADDPEERTAVNRGAGAQVIRAIHRCAEGAGAVAFHQTGQRGGAGAAIGHCHRRALPHARADGADTGEAGAGDTRAQGRARQHLRAVDVVALAAGEVDVLAAGPGIGGIHPEPGLIGGPLQHQATAISGGIVWAGDCTQLEGFVIHRDHGGVDRGGGAVDGQVARNRQVPGHGAAGQCQVDAAQIRDVATDQAAEGGRCSRAARWTCQHQIGVARRCRANERARPTNRQRTGGRSASAAGAEAVIQNLAVFVERQLCIGQAAGRTRTTTNGTAFDTDRVRHGLAGSLVELAPTSALHRSTSAWCGC